ncbi:MAG: response regulator [Acholeplasmataceae bacterium]|nr:response regulator [Acholeplasmataceae bacterium]
MIEQNYKIILVDDEEEIRNRIASKIPKNMGFDIVGYASNGADALDVIEKQKPDVVFTDIRMPFVDGIELSKTIRKEYPTTKIVFISGYDEFIYAKEAIDLDVISYLSKPITAKEVIECLNKVKIQLDEEYQNLFNQEKLDDVYRANLPALIENQFNTLLHLSAISDQDLERFRVFDINLRQGKFIVGIIEIEDILEFLKVEQLRIFLINLLGKAFENYLNLFYFNSGYGLVFIINDYQFNHESIEPLLYSIILKKNEFSPINIQMGISDIFDDFKQFPNYLIQAKKALSYANYLNIGNVIYYKDISTRKTIELQLTKDEINEISYTLKFKSKKDIHQLFEDLSKNHDNNQNYLLNKQYYVINLASIFVEFSHSLHVNLRDFLELDILESLIKYDDLPSMFEFLEDLTLKIRLANIEKSKNQLNVILDKTISYLNTNYMDSSLSMEVVADTLGVSSSYLSMLFKKELDTSFNQFLIKIRMDQARELLKFTHKKISEIASIVGYNDVYYFSYSFKKYTKFSPREYRNDQKT